MDFEITREIGIDAGHRVTYHGSKCRNLHGHRYTIQATCLGELFEEGEQEGMVLDFGFLKEEMMNEIDAPCDHGMMLWDKDPLVDKFVPALTREQPFDIPELGSEPLTGRQILDQLMRESNYVELPSSVLSSICGKMYIVPFVPTAENLAKHWFERLAPHVEERTKGKGHLKEIKVWETPNCMAKFPV